MRHYILRGKRVALATEKTAGKWYKAADRTVAFTKLPKNVEISTVFLGGLDSMFETMIFGGKYGKKNKEYQYKHTSWQSAEAGHLEAVKLAMG